MGRQTCCDTPARLVRKYGISSTYLAWSLQGEEALEAAANHLLLGGAAAAWPLAASAQQAGRTYRVGGLSNGARNGPPIVAMFNELRRFGFIEGQNLTIEWCSYGSFDLIPELAAELVKSKVDIIYASGDAGIRAAQRATTTIPILGGTDDMVEAGLVKSLARPDGNATGASFLAANLTANDRKS